MTYHTYPVSLGVLVFNDGNRTISSSARTSSTTLKMTTDILVGSYSTHLQILTFDAGAKTLQLTTVPQPSFERYTWISRHPVHQNLFYAGQNPAQGGIGSVTLFKVTGGSGAAHQLEVLQTVPSGGVGPCHLNVKPDGTQLAVANVRYSQRHRCKRSTTRG